MSHSNSTDMKKGLMINGPRPFPLRINKDSHAIHKHKNLSKKRQPVIIYTHSPRVIHAQATDFMALVQKLTGLSRDEQKTNKHEPEDLNDEQDKGFCCKNVKYEDKEYSSLRDEKFIMGEVKNDSSAVSPVYNKVDNACMDDIPLYTPNSNEFFSSFFQSPVANSISSGLMDYY